MRVPVSVVVGSLIWTSMFGVSIAGAKLSAQGLVALAIPEQATRPVQASQSVRQNPLMVVLTVDIRDVPIREALNTISERSGVAVVYSPAIVPMDRKVSVQGTGITLSAVLEHVLAGTNAEARLAAEGKVVIGKKILAEQVIAGRVLHAKTKQPIVGAAIQVDGKEMAVTGQDGSFRVGVPSGERIISARAIGFIRQAKKIVVTDEAASSMDFVLEPNASVLDEVVVTGTVVATERKAIPNPITVITAAEIEQRGITRVEQLFRGAVPGVIALEQGSEVYGGSLLGSSGGLGDMERSEIYARGASNLDYRGKSPLKTYIDGVEILNPNYLGTIDPQSIERIEIITGPQAATVYGSGAMGGVMQIFTKKGGNNEQPELTLSLKYGMLENNLNSGRSPKHQHTLNVSGGGGPAFSYAGSVSYNFTGQWMPGLFARRYGASLGASHSRGALTANASVSTTFGSNGLYERAYFWGDPFTQALVASGEFKAEDAAGRVPVQRRATSQSQTISLTVDYRINTWLQNSLTLGRNQTAFDAADDRPKLYYASDTLFGAASSIGQKTTAAYNITMLHSGTSILSSSSLALGVNGASGGDKYINGCFVARTATAFIPCNSGSSVSVTKPTVSESWGGFGRWQVGFADRLYLTFGVRAETNQAYGGNHQVDWSPNNGITYTMDVGGATVKMLGSYGLATRPPHPSMKLLQLSNSTGWEPGIYVSQLEAPDLTPEYSRGPQMGVEVYYGTHGSFTLNHYQQNVTDLIQAVRVDSVFLEIRSGSYYSSRYAAVNRYMNAASIRQRGWEATGSLNLWLFDIKGAYSWTDSRIRFVHPQLAATSSWYPGREMPGVPTHTGNVIVQYARGGTNLALESSFIGRYNRYSSVSPLYDSYYKGRLGMYVDRLSGGLNANLPGYTKSNISVVHRMSSWASVTVNVENVGNSYDSDTIFRNAVLGRQTLLGLSLRYPAR